MTRTMLVLGALVLGCGGERSSDDAGLPGDAGRTRDDAGAAMDGGGPMDAAATGDAGACTPASGPSAIEGYCQQIALSVLRFDDASPSLYATGLVTSVGDGCVAVDRVELRTTSGDLVQVLEPAGPVASPFAARASAVAPELLTACDGEDGRFDPYAVEIHGRTDGGTFVARCGAEAFGSGWPPDLVLTCHQNLPVGATYMGSGMITRSSAFTSSELWFLYPNEAGLVIDAVDPDVRIIPGTWGFGSVPIDPFDTNGWEASVGFPTSARTHVSVSLTQLEDPLGDSLCPIPSSEPGPEDPVPAVFLARVSGTAGGRAFTSEAMISYCHTIATGGP